MTDVDTGQTGWGNDDWADVDTGQTGWGSDDRCRHRSDRMGQ